VFECHEGKEICLFPKTIQTGFGLTQTHILGGIGGFFLGVKRSGREADHSRVSGARTSSPLYTLTECVGISLLYVLLCIRERFTIAYLFKSFLSQYLTNLMHKICFTISFISCLYMFRAHVLIIRRSKLH